jgi:DnaD/phage-associated family protein
MAPFHGFPAGKAHLTPIPASFFSELLPDIDHLGELKVTLFAFWFLDRQEGTIRYITRQDFSNDARLMAGLGEDAAAVLEDSLARAVRRGSLLCNGEIYFLNSARGRAGLEALQRGEWQPEGGTHNPASLDLEQPNIFRLYEENIGPLTPMIAEMLRDAESAYPQTWIHEAFEIAVKKNARNWRYIEKILQSWQEKGRDGTHREDSEENRRKYVSDKWSDIFEH